jgi:hypothetical protein
MQDDVSKGVAQVPYRADARGLVRTLTCLECFPFGALGPGQRQLDYSGRYNGRAFDLHLRALVPARALATRDDLSTMLYFVAKHAEQLDAGRRTTDIMIRMSDLISFIGRPRGGRSRHLLRSALARLSSTQVETTAFGPPTTFTLLEDLRMKPGSGVAARLPSVFETELAEGRTTRLGRDSLCHRGLSRCLVGWAHALCRNGDYEMPFSQAHARSGSRDQSRKFAHALRASIVETVIDGFRMSVNTKTREDFLRFDRVPFAIDSALRGSSC